MKIEVISHKKNPLVKREEFEMLVEHSGRATPTRKELADDVAKKANTSHDLIIIDKVISIKGAAQSRLKILAYKKKEDMPKHKLEKMAAREKKGPKGAEAAAEGKPPKED